MVQIPVSTTYTHTTSLSATSSLAALSPSTMSMSTYTGTSTSASASAMSSSTMAEMRGMGDMRNPIQLQMEFARPVVVERRRKDGPGGGFNLADAWVQQKRKNADSLRSRTTDSSTATPSTAAPLAVEKEREKEKLREERERVRETDRMERAKEREKFEKERERERAEREKNRSGKEKEKGMREKERRRTSPAPPTSPRRSAPSSNASGSISGPRRHLAQQERVYSRHRYDAEFDRGSSSAGGGASQRILWNPNLDKRVRSRTERPSGSHGHGHGNGHERDELASSTGSGAISGGPGVGRKLLFDPYRDDPVKFAKRGDSMSVLHAHSATSEEEMRSIGSAINSMTHSSAGSSANGSYPITSIPSILPTVMEGKEKRERRRRGDGGSRGSRGRGGRDNSTNGDDDVETKVSSETNPFLHQLRIAHKDIVNLENKLKEEHDRAEDEQTGGTYDGWRDDGKEKIAILVGGGNVVKMGEGKKVYDDAYWVRLREMHKRLADTHLEFMRMALNPQTPASYHSLPNKQNIPNRLWENAFHRLLRRMRNSIPPPNQEMPEGSADVLEHFRDFMMYVYSFLTHLLDEVDLAVFRNAWLEQLGDVARYMMLAASVSAKKNARKLPDKTDLSDGDWKESGGMIEVEGRMIRDGASIGEAALNDWDLEEQETWRTTARSWFGLGLKETPGTGRLHHHLALLCKGDELKALYHYSRSLTASHPYISTKESILPLFDKENQARRSLADGSKVDLFVKLHGMLFTRIALDDFAPTLARLEEKFREDASILKKEADGIDRPDGWKPISEVEWIMMAVINVAALMQYGAEDGVLKKAMTREMDLKKPQTSSTSHSFAPVAIIMNSSATKAVISSEPQELQASDVSVSADEVSAAGSPPKHADVVKRFSLPQVEVSDAPPAVFELAQQLSFSLLSYLLKVGGCRSVGQAKIVCPYIIIMLTFLSHVSKHSQALAALEKQIPWLLLTDFFNKSLPADIEIRNEVPEKLAGAMLPEDWCIRGMEWVGKNLFGRGYWKPRIRKDGESTQNLTPSTESEMDVLSFDGDKDWTRSGVVEIGEESSFSELATNRWKRVVLTFLWLARSVPGLVLESKKEGVKLVVLISLADKMRGWQEDEERKKNEEEERRKKRDFEREEAMLLDAGSEEEDEDEDECEDDDEVVKELKQRRRELRALLKTQRLVPSNTKTRRSEPLSSLQLIPGYTTLVFDTNVFLGSISLFTSLLNSHIWTVVVPLTVIMELEGLKKKAPPLGQLASDALTFIENSLKPNRLTLKIQTSKGNFLSDLTFRNEAIDFGSQEDGEGGEGYTTTRARNVDDVILRVVEFNQKHWSDRSKILGVKVEEQQGGGDNKEGWAKVVLVTFDRNLRLKAGVRDLEAVREREMAQVIGVTQKLLNARAKERSEEMKTPVVKSQAMKSYG